MGLSALFSCFCCKAPDAGDAPMVAAPVLSSPPNAAPVLSSPPNAALALSEPAVAAPVAAALLPPSPVAASAPAPKPVGSLFTSAQAIKRLQSELRSITRNAESIKEAGVSVGLPDETNLLVWDAYLYPGPGEKATLYESMRARGMDKIHLRLTFPPDYPRAPPEVLIVSPRIRHKYNFSGALCADILTAQHWKPTYRIDQLLIHILAFLQMAEFGATVLDKGSYNLKTASKFFKVNIERPDIWSWQG